MTYIGRFAPTPTGPLHFGSLVTALASYLDAKHQRGQWLLRIEDLDPPREDPTASALIPKQLIAHGLIWDGEVQVQSQHSARYEQVLTFLKNKGQIFPCVCSRKMLADQAGLHHGDGCQTHSNLNTKETYALRFLVKQQDVSFTDRVYGKYTQDLAQVGDQILKRKDGLYAYQLAVLVDDYDSGVTHVVRGLDLMDNTPRQIHLLDQLGWFVPCYMHIPLITNQQGQKLSKQNRAEALDLANPVQNLLNALDFLQQAKPPASTHKNPAAVLAWATEHWQVTYIPSLRAGLLAPDV
ncbi:MAG: glutamyl-Q tRNA(Asp) synthetase [Crocinitomicaceae bacterium]|jgi:glutamyl-Q tRNA(Asp) synthetase